MYKFPLNRLGSSARTVSLLAQKYSTSPFVVFLTVLSIAIARWSRQETFPIRSVCNARYSHELSSVVGFMVGADSISISVDLNADFVTNLRVIEAEYFGSVELRIPGIPQFSPQLIQPSGPDDLDIPNEIAVVINYSAPNVLGEAPFVETSEKEVESMRMVARTPKYSMKKFSPICLIVDEEIIGLRLHGEQMTDVERIGLVSIFSNVMEELSLMARDSHG